MGKFQDNPLKKSRGKIYNQLNKRVIFKLKILNPFKFHTDTNSTQPNVFNNFKNKRMNR